MTGKDYLLEQLKTKNCTENLGFTQEGSMTILWYNDEINSTKCLVWNDPYYESLQKIRQAREVLEK